MKKLYIYFLVYFFLLQFALADVVINEVMYNPTDALGGRYNEWIELYNPTDNLINLTGWKVADPNNHTLEILSSATIEPKGYFILAKKPENFSQYYSVTCPIAKVAFYLSNDGEQIFLKNSSDNLIDSLTYSNSWGANGDGYTLEKINPSGTNSQDNWGASLVVNGTPGYQNSIYGTGEIDYSLINITEFLPNPEGNDSAPMPDGEWIELYNPTNAAMDLKWMFFKDLFGHTLYITDTTVKDESTIIPANGYLVVYTNGKSGFLNNDGQEVLEFYDKDGELIKNVSYIDPVEGNSYAYVEGIGWQHTKPTPGEENVNYSDVKDSKLEIEKIYDLGSDKIAKFGQTVRVKAYVYKGDTTKNSITLYVENRKDRISKQSKTNVYTKYTDYELVIPIQLKPNCDEKFDDDDYYVYIKGLDKEDKKKIEVEDITTSLCRTIKTSASSKTKSKFSYELIDFPEEIENNNEFFSELELDNNEKEDVALEIWSYVYRGSKCYSGEREENKINVEIPPNYERTVKLYNSVSDVEPGDYKLKIKLKLANQKTAKEMTEDIKVVSKQTRKNDIGSKNTELFMKNKGVVYESSNIKLGKIVYYLIIILTTLLSIILIWKR